jgi:hypothetical protein
MRDDIFSYGPDGSKYIDFAKAVGGGYGNGWFTNCRCRYRFFVGGRNTKKSKDMIGYENIAKILSDPRRNILICRQNDSDNRQSTFENICGCIIDLGLERLFDVCKNPLQITYAPTKQSIIFRGLNNPTSLNGITFAHGFLTDVCIDEAFEVADYADFRKLDGSLRSKLPDGLFLQITCCMNAWSKDTWVYTEFFKQRLEDDCARLESPSCRFIDYCDPSFIGPFGQGLYLHKSTYRINEFRDPAYDASAEEMRRRAPNIFRVEYCGEWGNATTLTYPEFTPSVIRDVQQIIGSDPATGAPLMDFADFAIGIDTGLSNGQGGRRTVSAGQDPAVRIKSATTMQLCAVTSDFSAIVSIDEYFHSNDRAYSYVNTDTPAEMTEPQLIDACADKVIEWERRYAGSRTILMKGTVNIYVDCADIGFRQALEAKLRNTMMRYECCLYGSTKISIQSRVDFDRYMLAYGSHIVCSQCPNLIREYQNSRRGEKGEAREDTDDHALNAAEYGFAPLLPAVKQWKQFKQR